MELGLLRTLMDKEFYEDNPAVRHQHNLFSKDVMKIKNVVAKAIEKYQRSVTPDEVEALFYVENPSMTTPSSHPLAKSAIGSPSRTMHATLLGTGSALPERVIDNRYFVDELQLDTTPEWIVSKTGIEERRYVEAGQDVVGLAADAGLSALEAAGLTPDQLDLIINNSEWNEEKREWIVPPFTYKEKFVQLPKLGREYKDMEN